MTASPSRRRRATLTALAVTVVVLAGVVGLGIAGMRTLANSTAGRQASVEGNPTPTARLPSTATALVGVVDDTGRLTSSAIMVLQPDGTGGTIVNVAASADGGSGTTGELVPLDAALAAFGPLGYAETMELLTGLSFDVVEVVDINRLAGLIAPLGDLTIQLPVATRNGADGQSWQAGEVVAPAPQAARLLTAVDPGVADWYHEPARAAVWNAIADRVGAGIGSAEPVVRDLDLPPVATLDEFVDRLFADRVEARSLGFEVLDDARVAAERSASLPDVFAESVFDVVVHDRSEMLLVLGAIAPARLGAPIEALRVRLVSGFSGDELAAVGLDESELLRRALDRLLDAGFNIVSVALLPDEAEPDLTLIRVADRGVVDGVDADYGRLLGSSDTVLAGVAVDGVDIEFVLGRSALEGLAER